MSSPTSATQNSPIDGFIPTIQEQYDLELRLWTASFQEDKRFIEMGSEVSKYVVGPMPVDDFLQRFLRSLVPNLTSLPTVSYEKLKTFSEATEDNLGPYTKFIDAVESICPKFLLRDTHLRPMDTFESLKIQPDICVFDRGANDDTCNPSNLEIMITLRPSNADDPFDDNGQYVLLGEDGLDTSETETYLLKETEAGRRTLGQITAYAAAQQAAQFRKHIYSVLVFPEHARLLRWDRSGVVVTERFLLCLPYLMEFFHYYNHATPHARGIDISVTIPSLENASKARETLGIATSPSCRLVQLSLRSSAYIVSRETYMNYGCPLGRSTRTFVGYSVCRDDKVFLKDSWRLDYQTPEHQLYSQLHSSNVPHIPTVVDGGDILDHTTVTQDLLEENLAWIREPPRRLKRYRHYRLVLHEVATPLQSFTSTKLLVTAIHDAMKAHYAAYFEAGILHRDISPDNIMIHNGAGLLIDWDLSINIKYANTRDLGRTAGTWQFMSANLVQNRTAVQGYIDDVESFAHVFTWISFLYAKHDMGPNKLNVFMTSIFDYFFHDADEFVNGGNAKLRYLITPIELKGTKFRSSNLQKLLRKITKTISIRYKETPSFSEDALDNAADFAILCNYHAKRLAILEDPTWMISEFASALSLPNWPDGDNAICNLVAKLTTGGQILTSKRKGSTDGGPMEIDKRLRVH